MSDENEEEFDSDQETKFQTSIPDLNPTVTQGPAVPNRRCQRLCQRYDQILSEKRHSWTTHLRLLKKLGSGGQGVVYLTERRGSDGFTLPVALKVFSPERYATPVHYDSDMARMGRVAAKVAQIQHENLLVVENFLDRERIRMMVMEWVEGFDLRRLLTPKMFGIVKERFSKRRWIYLNDVLVTAGPEQPRFRPGVAVAIVRNCLEALAAMHRQNIVHGDVKPGNIMLKRSGHAKIIDIGSAFDLADPPQKRACTPAYAALEVLEGRANTPRSDLASLGYVLIELIAGRPVFGGLNDFAELVKAKRTLAERLEEIVPEEVANDDLLMAFLTGMISPDPEERFPTAEDANLEDVGAAAFHRQLIKNDMSTEYENDIRIWIDELLEIEMEEPGLLTGIEPFKE
ncbi:MAG: serine/threonine-protein kinase [Planctomycetota bacterium]